MCSSIHDERNVVEVGIIVKGPYYASARESVKAGHIEAIELQHQKALCALLRVVDGSFALVTYEKERRR